MMFAIRIIVIGGVLLDLNALVVTSLKVWLALRAGKWTVKKAPVWRAEQPRRFWFWTSFEMAMAVFYAAGAVILVWALTRI